MDIRDLISEDYCSQNRLLHEAPEGFGGSGWKHAWEIYAFARKFRCRNILDYGCGEGTLRRQFRRENYRIPVVEYDPAVKGKDAMPLARDLVVATDVLEHVEPGLVDNVLKHIHDLSRICAYLVIATRPANKTLPNGQNAHAIIEDTPFWEAKVRSFGWTVREMKDVRKGRTPWGAPHEVRFWLVK